MAALTFDWGVSAFIQMGTTPDQHDSSRSYMMVAPSQDTSLPPEIYDQNCGAGNQQVCTKIKQAYIVTITNLLILAKIEKTQAKEWAKRIWALEKQLVHATDGIDMSDEAKQDEQMLTAGQFTGAMSGGLFDFSSFMFHLGKPVDQLGKIQPIGLEAIVKINQIAGHANIESLRAYMAWHTIKTYAPWLDQEIRSTYNKFFIGMLMGHDSEPSAKEQAQHLTESLLGSEVGALYAEAYFTPATRIWGMDMIKNLIQAFKNAVSTAQWITTERTRQGALMKAENFLVKLGQPEQPPDHTSLYMVPGNVVESMINANRFYFRRMLDECNAPTDFTEWGMTPQTVNAYYNPTFNEFVIPAGIFQKPFFDITASAALNYGSLGGAIAHEMTHSIDPTGRQFNWKGNRETWSDLADNSLFDKIIDGMVAQANTYKSFWTFGIKLNGDQMKGRWPLIMEVFSWHGTP